ncbi:NIF3-like protein 1 isoform X1 [Ornithorhynchus anatinus]|uniref:NIF3-like protein 1 n=1 Tax=Ornithorhynchus anatinus TaxID=9258 RepID=A0A6I8NA41_ORNAN|nr:NIF3-like protein 1 isoform X1 [Ornithorhynchus anatinus]
MLPSRGRLILQSLLPVPHPARGRPPVRPSASRRSPAASPGRGPMELQAVVASLEAFASLAFAESWDNVGLLVEPSPPHSVRTLFLTNDLTEEVMDEALAAKADLILSYHPPVFRPLKRLTWKSWKERLVIRALENRVGIYSPHTASDAAPQGVNHWLAKGLGACTSLPIHPATGPEPPTAGTHRVELRVSSSRDLDKVLDALRGIQGTAVATFSVRAEGEEKTQVSVNCSRQALLQVVAFLSQNQHLYEKTEILSLEKPPLLHTGMGRLCALPEPVSVAALIRRVKTHLNLAHVRLALGAGKTTESPVSAVAVCAGSGSSVLRGVAADLYLTGEMSHHEVLDAVAGGITVVLCEHSNTERGFLSELRNLLVPHLENKVRVVVSEKDRDPLRVA